MTKKMINKEEFFVEENEFVQVPHDEFNNLIILESLGIQERIISLLKEIALIGDFKLKCINITHGGFIPIKTSSSYREINVIIGPQCRRKFFIVSVIKNGSSHFHRVPSVSKSKLI